MSRHFFTEEQIRFLRGHSKGRSRKDLTALFNKRFGVSVGTRSISGACVWRGMRSENNGRFRKGIIPWNTGLKGNIKAPKNSFQPGEMPHNWVPVGTERTNKDGIIEVKVKETKTWMSKHRMIWEGENGPTPKGCAIIFADRNCRNFNLDNLVCVTLAELLPLNKNGLISNDPNLTRAGLAMIRLILKTNKLTKKKKNKRE